VNWKDPVVVIEPTTVNIDEAVTSYGDLESLVVSKIGTLIRGDLNADGAVDAADAGIMFGNWGTAGDGDLNGDCIVDAADAGILFANWTGDPQPGAVWAAAVDEVWKHERTWL